MAFAVIDRRTCKDEKYQALDRYGRGVWLYLLVTHAGNMVGYFKISPAMIAEDLGWRAAEVKKGIEQLVDQGMVRYCHKTSVVRIVNYLKYNPVKSVTQIAGAITALSAEPRTEFAAEVLANLMEPVRDLVESVRISVESVQIQDKSKSNDMRIRVETLERWSALCRAYGFDEGYTLCHTLSDTLSHTLSIYSKQYSVSSNSNSKELSASRVSGSELPDDTSRKGVSEHGGQTQRTAQPIARRTRTADAIRAATAD
jgi:hypothetical protein